MRHSSALLTLLALALPIAAGAQPATRLAGQPGQELAHGVTRTLDFTAPASFRVAQTPYSSYEVSVDATSGDARPLLLEHYSSLSILLGQGYAEGTGGSLALPIVNATGALLQNDYVQLTGAGCSPCGPDDTYRIRMRETTLASPRFNNVGTQRSVLLVNNRGKRTARGYAYFWRENGTLLHTQPFTLSPNDVLKMELADHPTLAGQLGSVTVVHDAHYGDLAGKVAALDTTTGFSFSHLLAERVH